MNKKIVATLIILIMLFTSLQTTFAADVSSQFNSMMEDGEATITSGESNGRQSQVVGLAPSQSQNNTLASVLSKIISIIPLILNKLMSAVALDNEKNLTSNGKDISLFTIEGLLTNEYPLFDIDLFKNIESGANSGISNSIKNNAAIWYLSIRNITVVGSVIVLIYVVIRMTVATVAEDKAKYKQMMVSWLVGVILLFIIHYIVIIMIRVSNLFIQFISKAIESDTGTTNMEVTVLTNVFQNINKADGWSKLYYTALYCLLTYYEIKFFKMYIFRVFKIFIMMVISPLICLTYPIDKLGDGKAQGFNNWFRQMMMEIFIQPIHLIIYVVFIYSAGEIAKTAPLVAIVFIVALDNAEKIIRSALKIPGKGLKDVKILGEKGK